MNTQPSHRDESRSGERPARRVRRRVAAALAAGMIVIGPFLASPPASADTSPAIWVGSPVDATWGSGGEDGTTPAGGHHRLAKADPQNDWAGDLPVGAGSPAVLYVAPSDPAENGAVTTQISQIVDDGACLNGGGGDFVTVAIYRSGALYGHATFAHLDRDPALAVGQEVSRWGTTLGSVAALDGSTSGGSDCWTGPHVHVELRAEHQYACWNQTFATGATVGRSNFIGFVSGPVADSPTGCP